MSEDEELSIDEAAEKVFRTMAIQTIINNVPEYSVADTYKLPQSGEEKLEDLLEDLVVPMPASVHINPIFDANGKMVDFREVERNKEEMGGASTSMSLNRAPCLTVSGIKGSSSNVPFFPGGFEENLDNVLALDRDGNELQSTEEEYLAFENLLDWPTGFQARIDLSAVDDVENKPVDGVAKPVVDEKSAIDLDTADIFELMELVGGAEPLVEKKVEAVKPEESEKDKTEHITEGDEDLESLLATKARLTDPPRKPEPTFAYAQLLNTNADLPEYKELMPRMAKKYPFDLDPFQQASVVCMEKGESVFVAAHTSAGKTVVAEYAISLCKANNTRAIYTSPIKALSNQKFRDFKQIFDDVGLVTGDIQLHPEAFCLIMTTEILRSMLYNGSEVVRELEWVVFDEVHYINDAERGHVWEEVLIMLPSHVKIVMLSATVPNCVEFADWVGRIKNRRINVVSTYKRPVPLEHFLYTGQDGKTRNDIFLVVNKDGEFQKYEYRKAEEAKSNIRKRTTGPMAPRGGRGGGRGGGGGGNNFGKNDRNVYINIVEHLRKREELPAVIFVFSRKRCDENAQHLLSMDLTTKVEKSHIRTFFSKCIDRLKGTDKELPQVLVLQELCERGVGVHHSGVLPILKEVVELLFQKGYVKILFATETFAMGVNMPARTVVFDSITKHDGNQLRLLTAGEYIQMAGRAGRRGLDSTGKVVVVCKGSSVPDSAELQELMLGRAAKLESKFRVTYTMLLNLLRVEQLRIEDMLQRSYVESASLREGLAKKLKLEQANGSLQDAPVVKCETCNPIGGSAPLLDLCQKLALFCQQKRQLWSRLLEVSEVSRLFEAGRILVVTSVAHGLHAQLCILVKEMNNAGKKSLQLFMPSDSYDEINVELPKDPADRAWAEQRVQIETMAKYGVNGWDKQLDGLTKFRVVDNVPFDSIVAIMNKKLKIDAADLYNQYFQRKHTNSRFRDQPLHASVAKLLHQLSNTASTLSAKDVMVLGRDVNIPPQDLFCDMLTHNEVLDLLTDETALPAKHCVRFREHLSTLLDRLYLEETVKRLQHAMSSESLQLFEEYTSRLKMLKALEYVDNSNMVTFKGRVACEIHHQELLITELILAAKLHSKTAPEVAAILSVTTCQYKAPQECKFDEGSMFAKLQQEVQAEAVKILGTAAQQKVQLVEVGDELRYDLMEVVYLWAQGESFASIMEKTECQEGLIVRCIQRLGEVVKDVRNAARIVGDPVLFETMEQVSAAIKRDIVFAASLYTSV